MASLSERLGAEKTAQLKAWFAAQKARTKEKQVEETAVEFPLRAAEIFSGEEDGKKQGGSLGVDFVVARQAATLVEVGSLKNQASNRPKMRRLRVVQEMDQAKGLGGVVWHCGRVSCHLLPQLPEVRGGVFAPGTRLVELGCGTGVVGMACWLRGATVVLTDRPAVADLARANVRANFGDHTPGLDVLDYEWGGDLGDDLGGGAPVDVVFGSDCLYDQAALPALLVTLLALTTPTTVVYLAYKRRVDARERPFFSKLEQHFRDVRFTAPDAAPAEWRGTGLFLCRATGRRRL